MMLAAVVTLAFFLKTRVELLLIELCYWLKEEHFWNLPLRGPIFFILGCTITISFFSFIPALAGVLVLSITDSIGTLYGKYMGVMKIRWNPRKHMEGPIIRRGFGYCNALFICTSRAGCCHQVLWVHSLIR